jgi:hypothetical protein
MLLIGYCKFTKLLLSQSSFLNKSFFFLSDRFRTSINVFGDSIGCAVVQHLSRQELKALDNKRISVDYIDTSNPNTIVSLLAPNNMATYPSNHVVSGTYDNPAFPKTISDDEENMNTNKTYF